MLVAKLLASSRATLSALGASGLCGVSHVTTNLITLARKIACVATVHTRTLVPLHVVLTHGIDSYTLKPGLTSLSGCATMEMTGRVVAPGQTLKGE